MTYGPQFIAQLHRLGKVAEVKVRTETGQNAFGNMTDDYVADREVITVRTYPNRNTEVQNSAGDRQRDNPVFIVPKGDDQPAPPDPQDVLNYDGQDYEVKAHTEYDTHVEFFGEPLIHDESGM